MGDRPGIYRSKDAEAAVHRLYDVARARLPFGTESRFVATRFGATHLLLAGPGDGPPVLILQGGNVVNPLTLAWFGPLADRYRLVAPDTIGQPGRSAPVRLSANDASLAEWIADVMDALGLPDVVVVGASYGAGIVLRLAALSPGRVNRAALIVPAGLSAIPTGSMARLGAAYLADRVTRRRSIVEDVVRRLSAGPPDELMVESTLLAFRGTKLDTEMPRLATAQELAGFDAPVMVVAAERDPLFPPDRVIPAARRLFPNLVSGEVLRDAGHMLSAQAALTLAVLLRSFLEGAGGRPES